MTGSSDDDNDGNDGNDGKTGPGKALGARVRGAEGRPLPRRFYATVSVGPPDSGGACAILLDGRTARTPGKRELRLSTAALAAAVAAEWSAQEATIDPARMPLTRLANTAIDGVAVRMADVAADIVKYSGSDLVCYRAEFPDALASRQASHWDPILTWARERHGINLVATAGLMPVAQSPLAAERVADALVSLGPLQLTALHVMTTLMGSALLALAVLDGRLTAEAAWQAAHVDEDWQIAEWGEDAEAKARRQRRWEEMQASGRLLELLETP